MLTFNIMKTFLLIFGLVAFSAGANVFINSAFTATA